jgi:hypothetical protein
MPRPAANLILLPVVVFFDPQEGQGGVTAVRRGKRMIFPPPEKILVNYNTTFIFRFL